ncbi:hypothetical protein BaRGS_00008727 [Batillaria attramentaria]|uniref:Uncharacterized protein n=1 Tax=Batillaria attramentaria TaxID=370345 RepID=A0ABD0LL13_9CAEN
MASSLMQHIQFENWTPQGVADWLQGLDESVAQYVHMFLDHDVDGKKLMMLNHADLEKIGINKLGHQELVLEAVDLLRSLRYTLDTENLQSLALQLGCKARNLVAEIQVHQGENDQNRANMHRGESHRKRLSITVLSYVADLLTTLKTLVFWLDRAPFEGIYDICRLRNSVVKIGLDLVTVTQRESSYVDPQETITKSCRMLIEYCEGLVRDTKDPLVIQPAALELATIRKKQGEELGMNILSAYNGIHGISSIKDMSAADLCSKIEKGDEVLQVNGQTVLGWQLKQLVKILKDKPKEVSLLLKKRPRHINPLGTMPNHKRLAAKHAQQAATLPKSLKKRRSREGDETSPACIKLARALMARLWIRADTPGRDTPDSNDPDGDGNDTDNDVFRSGSESPQYTLPVMPDAKQRRATVSGGSPTFERNSLMVEDPVIRPKSQAINQAEREAALAVLTASENCLKNRMAEEKGDDPGRIVESGRNGSVLKKTSSESSSGHKGLSETEMEDSVFASDKEDKDQQNQKGRAADAKRQEFRVTKPTPVLLETPAMPVAKPPMSVSESSLPTFDAPLPQYGRPPSPVSAPPRRKKPSSASSQNESQAKPSPARDLPTVTTKPTTDASVVIKPKPVVPEKTSVVKASRSNTLGVVTQTRPTPAPTPEARHTDQTTRLPSESAAGDANTSVLKQKPSSSDAEKTSSMVLEVPDAEHDHRPHSVQREIRKEVATDSQHKDMPQLMKIKKLESLKAADALAIDYQHTGIPQLMKIKKLDPDAVSQSSSEGEGTPKVKKRVGFSEDAKEPHEVSYTHIVIGGVLQKIPIDKAQNSGSESPPVRLRHKPGSRRLDRRVSCKDLGKGDCEGWLYKRKEKDRVLAKHWNKRWCVLKNANLYYYKDKSDLKAEGVIFMPAFQVSPAPTLKTKK